MFTPVIVVGSLGFLLLIIQLGYFLRDYSTVLKNNKTKKYLLPNIIGLIGSVALIGLSVVYFFLVNNQL